MKYCPKCNKNKDYSSFNKAKHRDGRPKLSSWCKECTKKKSSEYMKTKAGVITGIWRNQRANAKARKMSTPSYTKEWLSKWLLNQPLFHKLYDEWTESGYKKRLKPSVDRIDDYKSYTKNNIQLMTFKENNDKAHSDKFNGLNQKQTITVEQYTKDGDFICEYYSYANASRETGINKSCIRECANGTQSHAGGYIWIKKDK